MSVVREKIDLAVLGAVRQEVAALLPLLVDAKTFSLCGEPFHLGTMAKKVCIIGTVGFNKANAAITTAAILGRFAVSEVWLIGCAGAYSDGPLHIGDVLITRCAVCGDEGILTQAGVVSAREIGIPVLTWNGALLFDEFPVDRQEIMSGLLGQIPSGWYRMPKESPAPADFIESLGRGEQKEPCRYGGGSFRALYGRSLTVGMASGDSATAAERFKRYHALAENMEGSAVAQACLRFGAPFVECRGISNVAGDRCKANWHLEASFRHCHGILLRWLDASASHTQQQS